MHPLWYIPIALGAVAIIWLFLIFPCLSSRMKREWRRGKLPRYYAHRGLHGEGVPENSLPAFRLAAERGYGIELDVQISRDGVPVVFHDNTLLRMTGKEGGIYDYTAEELGQMTLAGTEGVTIPTLESVLREVGGRVPLMVELKAELPEWRQTAAAALALLDKYEGEYIIESFNPLALKAVRRHKKSIFRGQLCAYFEAVSALKVMLRYFLFNFFSRPDFVSYCYAHADKLSFGLMHLLFARSTVFSAWTVRSAEEEKKCGKFDIIIFENYTPEQKYEN